MSEENKALVDFPHVERYDTPTTKKEGLMERLRVFYARHVIDRTEFVLFFAAMIVLMLGSLIAIYDVFTIVNGTTDLQTHMPFISSIGCIAIGWIVLFVLRN